MVRIKDDLLDNFFSSDVAANATPLTRALKDIKGRALRYRILEDYYRGQHDLCFATDKFRNAFGNLFRAFADNLCPAVCDAVTDNLEVTSFGVEEGSEDIGKQAWDLWQANRMDQRAGEIHLEAVKTGDAYAIVWPNDEGQPVIYPQKSCVCTVLYDAEQPGLVLWAAKFWLTSDKHIRGNIYYPDRIEKYITRGTSTNGLPDSGATFIKFQAGDESWPLPNEWGKVPVFHFANNGAIGQMGNSELVSAVPLQDALNKSILDMLVAMEFAAFPQRWATGIELMLDNEGKPIPPFIPGVERLWTVDSENAKFGQFDAAEIDKFLSVANDFRLEMARVTATPLHYLNLQTGQIPSGEALKTLEKRHVKKVKDRMTSFGNVWEDVMSLALAMAGKPDVRLSTKWVDAFGPSDSELLANLVMKQTLGVSEEQLLAEAGYDEADIQKMLAANAKKAAAARTAFQQDFNAQ